MQLVHVLLAALAAGLWVMFGYQAVLARWGWSVRPGPTPSEGVRFAVLIPAHDEELALGALLASLRRVDYPSSGLFVLVIADHCSDGTARVARAGDVACLERAEGPRGKAAVWWAWSSRSFICIRSSRLRGAPSRADCPMM